MKPSKLTNHFEAVTAGVNARMGRIEAAIPPATTNRNRQGQEPFDVYEARARVYINDHPEDAAFATAFQTARTRHKQMTGEV